jgi:hypothetical protein
MINRCPNEKAPEHHENRQKPQKPFTLSMVQKFVKKYTKRVKVGNFLSDKYQSVRQLSGYRKSSVASSIVEV